MLVEHKTQPAGWRAGSGHPRLSILSGRRSRSAVAAADDATLFAAVAALSVEAVEEAYERHASALCDLALLVVDFPWLAKDAVAEAFIVLWREPSSICLEGQSLRAALAGGVYDCCTLARQGRTGNAFLARSQRDLQALITLGDHNIGQAARRVGLSDDAAARMITRSCGALQSDSRRWPYTARPD